MSSVEELEEELKGYKQERMNLFKTIEQLQKTIKRKDNGIKALTKDLCEESENKERLNNIINELEVYCNIVIGMNFNMNNSALQEQKVEDYTDMLDKLKELKDDSNVED